MDAFIPTTRSSSALRSAAGPLVLALLAAMTCESTGWAAAILILAGLGFAGYVQVRRIGEQQAVAAQRRNAIRRRADRQHSWALRGDSRGFYGAAGAELMRRTSVAPLLDEIAAGTEEEPHVAAVTDTAEGLAALLTDRPTCWRYAVFASVLVQRRATLAPRLRDQQLGYAPPGGVRIHTGVELGQYMFDLLEQMAVLVGQIEELMLSPGFTRMFGDPDDEASADADTIVHAANRLMDIHERLLDLAERCRGVIAPDHPDVVRDCGRVIDVPLEGYRRFINEFVVRVGELPEVLRYARGTVKVDPVLLEMDDSDELLDKAVEGIRKLASGAQWPR